MPPSRSYKELDGKSGRKAYAFLASTASLFTAFLFLVARALFSSAPIVFENLLYLLLATLCGLLSAFVCWPEKQIRTKLRMIIAGMLTVTLSFLLMGLLFGFIIIMTSYEDVSAIFVMPFVFLFFGSLFTFGIPYIIGVLLSLLFVNEGLELDSKKT